MSRVEHRVVRYSDEAGLLKRRRIVTGRGWDIVYPSRLEVVGDALVQAIVPAFYACVFLCAGTFGWALSEALDTHRGQGNMIAEILTWGGPIVGGGALLVGFIFFYTDPKARVPWAEYATVNPARVRAARKGR